MKPETEYGDIVSAAIYDIEEIHPNCTVQILRNSVTGEVSVGWWDNENPPPGMENGIE